VSVTETHSRAWPAAIEATTEPLLASAATSIEPIEFFRPNSRDLRRAAGDVTIDIGCLLPLRLPPANTNGIRRSLLDGVIVPLAASAFAIKTVFRSALTLLLNVLDWTFPIVMQGARVPLFFARIIGHVVAAGMSGLVWLLPLSATRRRRLQAMIAAEWAKIRSRISYRAFEEALHHAFERGMIWVFRTCRHLTPRSALLVIGAAAAWFPITFGTSTIMHAFLLANATALPAWMQIFHFPVALMAKSKILVLPVYPAAWPQAKQHWFVRRVQDLCRTLKQFAVVQRLAFRYRQMQFGAEGLRAFIAKGLASAALNRASETVSRHRREAAAWAARRSRRMTLRASASVSHLWLIGPYLRDLVVRYSDTAPASTSRPSEKIRSVYARWAIKFTPGYYEAKERQIAHLVG
jgi:hypothetical protein